MRESVESAKPQSPSAVQKNIETVANLEQQFLRNRTSSDRITDAIAAFSGSMRFVVLHLVGFAVWILLNMNLSGFGHPFDPYPYVLLSLVVSCEAVLLSTFVLMKQNREARRSDVRDHLNLQIDLLAEKEITKMLQMQVAVCEHLGIAIEASRREIHELSQETAVEHLAAELKEKITERSEDDSEERP
jgi:uncharacterized membrane protein